MEGISGNLTINISDHLAQFLIIPEECYKFTKKHNLYKRDYNNVDIENFILDLLEINWVNSISVDKNDPNYPFNLFETKINSLIDTYLPLKNP